MKNPLTKYFQLVVMRIMTALKEKPGPCRQDQGSFTESAYRS
jgi:hypothetical protein